MTALQVVRTSFLGPRPRLFPPAACLQTSKGFFYSVNHLSGGGVNANHNETHSPSLARKNKIENDPKRPKNSEGNRNDEWNFC